MAALDVANASVLEFDLDAAPTRTHVPGHSFDLVADRRRILAKCGQCSPSPSLKRAATHVPDGPVSGKAPLTYIFLPKALTEYFKWM